MDGIYQTKKEEVYFDFGETKNTRPFFKKKRFYGLIIILLGGIALYFFFIRAPRDFPVDTTFTVSEGDSLLHLGRELKSASLIQSPAMFESLVVLMGGEKRIAPGEYFIESPMSVFGIAETFTKRNHNIAQIKITIPEGSSREDIASIISGKIPMFNQKVFLDDTKNDEGYLFPDTYFFFPKTKIESIVTIMKNTFNAKIVPLTDDIKSSGHTLSEIIIMASILEKEANTDQDRAIVSGILWKRITQGMPLQVDAPFYFLYGKQSSELTIKDLQKDSPYNTYTRKGLPIGPIGNPGLDAIRDAIHPQASEYLFYLSDKTGVIHFAKTFEEHKKNKLKYL